MTKNLNLCDVKQEIRLSILFVKLPWGNFGQDKQRDSQNLKEIENGL